MDEQNSTKGSSGLLGWTLLMIAGVIIGLALAVAVGWLTTKTFGGSSYADQPLLEQLVSIFNAFLFGGAIGVGIGLLQVGGIRRRFPSITFMQWIALTAIGMGLMTLIIWKADLVINTNDAVTLEYVDLAGIFVVGAVTGMIYGLVQWLALRRVAGTSWIWIPASALAWAMSFGVSYAILVFAVKQSLVEAIFVVDPSPTNMAVPLAIFIIVIGLLLGLVSGIALRIIGRSSQSSPQIS
jgi:hypothetical protein